MFSSVAMAFTGRSWRSPAKNPGSAKIAADHPIFGS